MCLVCRGKLYETAGAEPGQLLHNRRAIDGHSYWPLCSETCGEALTQLTETGRLELLVHYLTRDGLNPYWSLTVPDPDKRRVVDAPGDCVYLQYWDPVAQKQLCEHESEYRALGKDRVWKDGDSRSAVRACMDFCGVHDLRLQAVPYVREAESAA